jgi:hypothetical protein
MKKILYILCLFSFFQAYAAGAGTRAGAGGEEAEDGELVRLAVITYYYADGDGNRLSRDQVRGRNDVKIIKHLRDLLVRKDTKMEELPTIISKKYAEIEQNVNNKPLCFRNVHYKEDKDRYGFIDNHVTVGDLPFYFRYVGCYYAAAPKNEDEDTLKGFLEALTRHDATDNTEYYFWKLPEHKAAQVAREAKELAREAKEVARRAVAGEAEEVEELVKELARRAKEVARRAVAGEAEEVEELVKELARRAVAKGAEGVEELLEELVKEVERGEEEVAREATIRGAEEVAELAGKVAREAAAREAALRAKRDQDAAIPESPPGKPRLSRRHRAS